MSYRDRIQPIPLRINAHGQLVLTAPYRHYPGLDKTSVAVLKYIGSGLRDDPNSYKAQCAREELARRQPRTASLCFDVEKGWQPIVG